MIGRYIIWRNRNAHDRALRDLVKRSNVACAVCCCERQRVCSRLQQRCRERCVCAQRAVDT